MKRMISAIMAGRPGAALGGLASLFLLTSCGFIFPTPMGLGFQGYEAAQHDSRMRRHVSASMGYRARDRSRRQALAEKSKKGRSVPVHTINPSSGSGSHHTAPGVIRD